MLQFWEWVEFLPSSGWLPRGSHGRGKERLSACSALVCWWRSYMVTVNTLSREGLLWGRGMGGRLSEDRWSIRRGPKHTRLGSLKQWGQWTRTGNECEWKSPEAKNKIHGKEELAGPRSHIEAGFYCGWLGSLKMKWNVFMSPLFPAEKWRKGAEVGMPRDPSKWPQDSDVEGKDSRVGGETSSKCVLLVRPLSCCSHLQSPLRKRLCSVRTCMCACACACVPGTQDACSILKPLLVMLYSLTKKINFCLVSDNHSDLPLC